MNQPMAAMHDLAFSPVPLLLGKDDVPGGQVGEEADGRLFSARFPMLVKGVIVIVHLVASRGQSG